MEYLWLLKMNNEPFTTSKEELDRIYRKLVTKTNMDMAAMWPKANRYRGWLPLMFAKLGHTTMIWMHDIEMRDAIKERREEHARFHCEELHRHQLARIELANNQVTKTGRQHIASNDHGKPRPCGTVKTA